MPARLGSNNVEQFFKLPPAQRAAVIAAVLAVMAVGLYFLIVDPELARAQDATTKLEKFDKDIAALKLLASPAEQERLRKLREELVETDKENRKMLPAADEIPDFIDNVQNDAKAVGLQVRKFERLAEDSWDLYNTIPIKMAVEGNTKQLIQFMRIYAGPDRRMINIRDLVVEQIPDDLGAIKTRNAKMHPVEKDENGKDIVTAKGTTPEDQLREHIELLKLARESSQVRASFVAYAFTWTGRPAKAEAGKSAAKVGKKKRT